MAYSISTDEETYNGNYETIEEALEEASVGYAHTIFWLGTCRVPRQPEKFIDVDGMLDGLGDGHEDWGGEWAEWDGPTAAQIAALQKEFEEVMAAWLDRHKLRPRWFCIDDAVKYVVIDGVTQKAADEESEPTKTKGTEWPVFNRRRGELIDRIGDRAAATRSESNERGTE